jgi:hypothetical protein
MARKADLHRRNHPNPQVLRQGLCHRRWPPPSRHGESDHARAGEALSRIDSRGMCSRRQPRRALLGGRAHPMARRTLLNAAGRRRCIRNPGTRPVKPLHKAHAWSA